MVVVESVPFVSYSYIFCAPDALMFHNLLCLRRQPTSWRRWLSTVRRRTSSPCDAPSTWRFSPAWTLKSALINSSRWSWSLARRCVHGLRTKSHSNKTISVRIYWMLQITGSDSAECFHSIVGTPLRLSPCGFRTSCATWSWIAALSSGPTKSSTDSLHRYNIAIRNFVLYLCRN